MSAALRIAALAVALLIGAVAQGASCPAPPSGFGSSWWSSYKSWCRSCGGTICDTYNDCAGRCSIPSSAGVAPGALTPGAEIGRALGGAVASVMACKLFGQGCASIPDDPGARSIMQADAAAAQARLESADAAQRQADAAAQQRVGAVLAGGASGGLALRDLSGAPPAAPIAFVTATLSALQQLDCAEQLMARAADISTDLLLEARAELAHEAGNYLAAAPSREACRPRLGYAVASAEVGTRRTQAVANARFYERAMPEYARRAPLATEREALVARRAAGTTGLDGRIAEIDRELAAIDARLATLESARAAEAR